MLNALLLAGDYEKRKNRKHRAIHCHRYAHLIQRDFFEELAHVKNRIDCDSRHAYVASHARMIAVVPAMGREIERDL